MLELGCLYGEKMNEIVCNSDAYGCIGHSSSKFIHISKPILTSLTSKSLIPKSSILKSTLPIHFAIKVDKHSLLSVETFLLNQENIVLVHKLEFGFDFLVQGLFSNINDAESFFMMLLENFKILEIKKYYIIKTSIKLTEKDVMENSTLKSVRGIA